MIHLVSAEISLHGVSVAIAGMATTSGGEEFVEFRIANHRSDTIEWFPQPIVHYPDGAIEMTISSQCPTDLAPGKSCVVWDRSSTSTDAGTPGGPFVIADIAYDDQERLRDLSLPAPQS